MEVLSELERTVLRQKNTLMKSIQEHLYFDKGYSETI